MEPKLGGVVPVEDLWQGDREEEPQCAIRHNEGKLRYDLVPQLALEYLVRVYTEGTNEYPDRNWERGMPWSWCYAPLMRHLQKWWGGEDINDSGLPHLAHVVWNAMALLEYHLRNTGTDDRPYVNNSPKNDSPTCANDPNTCITSVSNTDVPLSESRGVSDGKDSVGTITRY